jgi:hypothetical protein
LARLASARPQDAPRRPAMVPQSPVTLEAPHQGECR